VDEQLAPGRPGPPRSGRTRELDLLLAVDRSAATPLRAQLEDAIRSAVREGRLVAGTALPSTRALAAELGVSRGVVVEAFGQLAADGFLQIHRGGATRVAHVPPPVHGPPSGPTAPATAPPAAPSAFDLLPMSGDLVGFPRRAWGRAIRGVVDATPAPGLSYGDPRGPERARTVLAAYLGRSRGVLATPDTTALTAGVTEGIGTLARALAATGARRIAVEDPGFAPHRRTLQDAGLLPVPVAVDAGGLRVELLDGAGVDAVLVTPAHQAPTGRPLSPERRTALVRWASEHGAVVLEDDYDGEFRYDRQAVGALQALAPDHVAYCGSVSKTLAPALRIGWVVAPAPLLDAATRLRLIATGGTAALEPLALAAMIDDGDYDRHLRGRRRVYAARRRVVEQAVLDLLPDGEPIGIPAGLSVPVLLPPALDPVGLAAAAHRRGVLVAVVPVVLDGREHTLVQIGFGRQAESGLRRAVGLLADAVAEVAAA